MENNVRNFELTLIYMPHNQNQIPKWLKTYTLWNTTNHELNTGFDLNGYLAVALRRERQFLYYIGIWLFCVLFNLDRNCVIIRRAECIVKTGFCRNKILEIKLGYYRIVRTIMCLGNSHIRNSLFFAETLVRWRSDFDMNGIEINK